jgi:ATP-dependent Clp protease ATP-binding subunit ClpX
MEGVELEFEDDALDLVAEIAIKRGTGARALRSILENTMLEIMYKLPTKEGITHCVITKDVIVHKKEPVYLNQNKKIFA